MCKDNRRVLLAGIGSLPIQRAWVVRRPIDLEQFLEARHAWVIRELHCFNVPSPAGANLFVTRGFEPSSRKAC
eukprot:scaffold104943_cov31-Tisochrysis_lutea.AAC.1